MIIITAFLLSVSSCLDNIVVGTAYGIKKIKIGIVSNVIIATITTIGTLLSMTFGKQIATFLPGAYSGYIGATILFLLGLSFVIQSIFKLYKYANYSEVDKNLDGMVEFALNSDSDKSGDIGKRESVILALGLTLNNIATGIAASFAGVNIILTSIFTYAFSIVSIYLGIAIGKNFIGMLFGKYAPLIAGVILIALGLIQIFH